MPKNKFINQIEPLIEKRDIFSVSKYLKTNGWITEHKLNLKFEKLFSSFIRSKYAVSFPNGTLAIVGILAVLDIKPNDEVIVPNYTMVATANAVKLLGAKPVFCDISTDNLCMDPMQLKNKINKKTKAIIYVTLNGRSGHINEIKKIANKNKLFFIEDSAHSIGSCFGKKHHGNFGIASAFSFSMPKIITTGQGGMVATNNLHIFKKLKNLKNFGRLSDGNDNYQSIGYNFKFTDLQAALGISQIQNIKKRIIKKRKIFNYYNKFLSKVENIQIFSFKNTETPWFVDIYLDNPKKLKNYLLKYKINTRLVYPALNNLKIYSDNRKLKNSSYFCSRGLWLPSSLNLSNEDIRFICKKIINFFEYEG